ncbi:hypothetical protein pVco7_gp013 [Vibrio phage pVco-7]|uniref:Uncharacterized protein n=1 Tax=Vibrio phage pVco-5 TaxID=1965485 RepID=A0A1W6JUR9_9CAUD|nr:hypothetical protein KNT61_gp014 [Vibrio phage pVco-5]ARM71002.1 hypothetical protein pVco5_014 [Vibrio phage pVco-5]
MKLVKTEVDYELALNSAMEFSHRGFTYTLDDECTHCFYTPYKLYLIYYEAD